MYEAQDTDLCKYVGEQLRDKVSIIDKLSGPVFELSLFGVSLVPQDCLSIGYFLAFIAIRYNGRFSVDLWCCSISDTGIKILMRSLCRSLDPHSEITGPLDLDIGCNQITGEGASYIAEVLRTTRALWKLNLNCNQIGPELKDYSILWRP